MKTVSRLSAPLVFILVVLAAGLQPLAAWALAVPALTARVNDTAHILSAGTVQMIEQTLQALEKDESTQIVVLTIPSLEDENLEQFATKVVESWKIGQKGLDNGALLLIAVQDRKIRIETGYGLEGSLTDLVAGRIIRNVIAPDFKRGEYDQGVLDGVTAMIAAVKGEFTGKGDQFDKPRKDPGEFLSFLIFGLLLIGNIFRRKKPLAAGIGGAYAPVAGMLFSGLSSWTTLLLLIPVGVLGALVASLFIGSGMNRGRGYGGSFPGGGGFGGGFGGGGGGFGGGFGGGGGSSGGGGASGGW